MRHYDCMTLDEIKALDVARLAARDCFLWLWATNPMVPQALDVVRSWGFTYQTMGHWAKMAANGGLAFGGGYVLRSAGEPFIIAKRGAPSRASRSVRSVIMGPRRAHSQKPEEAFAAAEALSGDVPRLEMFSRRERAGWDAFGDEVSALPDHGAA